MKKIIILILTLFLISCANNNPNGYDVIEENVTDTNITEEIIDTSLQVVADELNVFAFSSEGQCLLIVTETNETYLIDCGQSNYLTTIKKIKNLLSTTAGGEVLVNVYMDQNSNTPIGTFNLDTSNRTTPPLSTDKDWVEVYTNSVGNFIQLEFTLNDFQLVDEDKNTANFELHGILIQAGKSGELGSFA